MGNRLDIRQCARCPCVRRGVLSMPTQTLGGWPCHALDLHHPSHHGVRPMGVLHNAIVSSSPPRGNQEGDGDHPPISLCGGDAHPPSTGVGPYATLAGAPPQPCMAEEVDLLRHSRMGGDRLNAEHHHPMLGETRHIDVLTPTSWQGHRPSSGDTVGRPPRQRADVDNPCTIPMPEMHARRMRPTMPWTRHMPQSARPKGPHTVGAGIPNVSDGGQ